MMTESDLVARLSGKQHIHRLRSWEDGDTLYGAAFLGDRASTGKTFRDGHELSGDAEEMARSMYGRALFNGPDTHAVLYKATVRNPNSEPRNPADPGEPPLMFAHLEDVEILAHDPPAE